MNPSIGIMFKGHVSLTAEMLYQKYDAVDGSIPDGTVIATWRGYDG